MTDETTLHDTGTQRVRSRTRVGWPEVGVAALTAIVLYAVGIALFTQIPDSNEIGQGLAQYAVSGLAPLGGFAAAVALRIRDVRPFGLRRVSARWMLIAAAVGVGAVVLNVIITSIVVTVFTPGENIQGGYQAAAGGGLASFAGAIVLGAALTPLGEELLFRGVLANALARYGAWVAVLASSAVFALAHGVNHVLPVAFMVGVAAVLLLRRTGSVWPGVLVHAIFNASSSIIVAVLALTA